MDVFLLGLFKRISKLIYGPFPSDRQNKVVHTEVCVFVPNRISSDLDW